MKTWTLCSECFDETASEGILQIVPLSICGRCGRRCLGHVTETDAPSAAAIDALPNESEAESAEPNGRIIDRN